MPKAKPKTKKTAAAKIAPRTVSRKKQKLYPMWYLWVAVVAVVLIECAVIGFVTPDDIKYGVEILDFSDSVEMTKLTVLEFTGPMAQTFSDIEEFYNQAATELIYLLENDSVSEVKYVVGLSEKFYNQAADQMIALLDASDYIFSSKGSVAGISIEK